ncbi:MAG: hypothetical protein ACTSUE_11565 [Promethearchaeota archaeon]
MKIDEQGLVFLKNGKKFKEILENLSVMASAEKRDLLNKLERHLTSSSWVSNEIFKPGVRNLFIQEKLGAKGMYNKLVIFLGDQYYHFKFFFQEKMRKGEIPAILNLLRQGVNLPRFRFRLESMECLIEIQGCLALPAIINLLNGFDKKPGETSSILNMIRLHLDDLAACMEREEKYRKLFSILQMRMLELDSLVNDGSH